MTRALIITITAVITLCVLLADSASAHPAWGIVVDRNNQIYFSDIETIWKIDVQGKLTVFRAGVRGRHTHEINLDEKGNLYGVDNAYDPATQRSIAALWKITPSGKFSYVLAPTYHPPKAMTISKDRIGNSYYVGQSENAGREIFVLKRTPDGKVTTLAGSRKVGDEYRQVALYGLSQVVFGADGALYFRDGEGIRKVTMDGKMTALPYKLEGRAGFTIDGQDNIFAADPENRRVLKISPGGESTAVFSSEQPWMPNGVALSGKDLYILESWYQESGAFISTRVRKLSADGKITVLATVGDKPTRAANNNPVLENPVQLDHIRRIEARIIPPVLIRGRALVRASLAERMADLSVPGVSIAVVDHGVVVWAKAYGEMEKGTHRAVTTATLFQAGSISKALTALAALRLVDRGVLTLDDDVNRWLRTWRVPENEYTRSEKVTLRRLLSHSAGVTVSGFDGYPRGTPTLSLRDVLLGQPPVNSGVVTVDKTPGSIFRYSGGGYTVLAQLIEDVTGQSFPNYMNATVLAPLGMTASTFESLSGADAARAASGHRGDGTVVSGKWHLYPERSAAGLWSTPSDLARYVVGVQRAYDAVPAKSPPILSRDLARAMVTPVRNSTFQGLGPRLRVMPGEAAPLYFTHNGGTDGYTSTFFGYLAGGRAIIVMTNGWNGLELALDLARTIATEYGWTGHEPTERVTLQLSARQLDTLAGTYIPLDNTSDPPFVVRVEAGHLVFGRRGRPAEELFAQSDTSFFLNRRLYPTVTFERDAEGRGQQLVLRGGALTVTARRAIE